MANEFSTSVTSVYVLEIKIPQSTPEAARLVKGHGAGNLEDLEFLRRLVGRVTSVIVRRRR